MARAASAASCVRRLTPPILASSAEGRARSDRRDQERRRRLPASGSTRWIHSAASAEADHCAEGGGRSAVHGAAARGSHPQFHRRSAPSIDTLGNVTYLNLMAERLTGWPETGSVVPAVRRRLSGDRRHHARARAQFPAGGGGTESGDRDDAELFAHPAGRRRAGDRRHRVAGPRSHGRSHRRGRRVS